MTMADLRLQTGTWNELLDELGEPRPAATALVETLRLARAVRGAGPPGPGRPRHPHHGHHVHRVLRRRGHRPHLADGRDPPRHRRRRVADDRGRAHPAPRRPEPLHRRPLQRPGHRARRRRSRPRCSPDRSTTDRSAVGVHPPLGVWAHISGSDLVRDADGTMYVLEDNLRVPSGVSYLLENRLISKRAFADLFQRHSILPVDGYTDELHKLLASLAPPDVESPRLAVLTPGIYNSAYFEHSFLAQRMGATLVEGRDLFVADDDHVYMRTIDGPAAGGRDLPAHRRPLPRPGGVPPRLDARREGAAAGVEGGQRRPGQRARRRRGRRQGRVRVGARHHPLLPRRGTAHPERADVPLPDGRRAGAT